MEEFPIDSEYLLVTPGIKKPESLIDRMVPNSEGDYKSAIALYEAYESLKPLQAVESSFWESLALTDLFPYMQKRWELSTAKDLKSAILNHFFVRSHGIIRHGLGGLWWLTNMSINDDSGYKYELTEVLFKNYTLRFIRFGATSLIQHKEAALGILQYLKDNEDKIISYENVANNLSSYFNKLGAVKQLSYLKRDFFYSEMANHIHEFNQISSNRLRSIEDED